LSAGNAQLSVQKEFSGKSGTFTGKDVTIERDFGNGEWSIVNVFTEFQALTIAHSPFTTHDSSPT